MKNSILYKLLKWMLGGSAITFFAILISVVLFIFGRYPDLLEYRDTEFGFCTPLKDYYNFFSDTTIKTSIISTTSNDTQYCHILIIDRTMSTLGINEDGLAILKDSLSDKLFCNNRQGNIFCLDRDTIRVANERVFENTRKKFSFTIQHYLILHYYKKLVSDTRNNAIIVGFFDGDTTKTGLDYYPIGKTSDPYIPLPANARDDIFHKLCKEPLMIPEEYLKNILKHGSQISDFHEMFDEINRLVQQNVSLQNANIILTIISDFDHDEKTRPEITDEEIAIFKRNNCDDNRGENNNKISQYNFIHCIPSDPAKKEKSEELIKKLMKEIEGCVNLVQISTEIFNKVDPTNHYNFLDNEFMECLNPIIDAKKCSKIMFNYPIINSQGIETTKARIQLPVNFKWKIKTLPHYEDATFFISYSLGEDAIEKTKIHSLPQVEFQDTKDNTLYFEIETGALNDILKKRIRLKTISKDATGNDVYGIHSFKFLEANVSDSFKDLAKTILDALCFSLILIFISGTCLLCYYLKDGERASCANWLLNIFGMILILGISFYVARYLLYPHGKVMWLKISFFTVLFSTIVNLLFFVKWCIKSKITHYIRLIDQDRNINMAENNGIEPSEALYKLDICPFPFRKAKLYPLRSQSTYLTANRCRLLTPLFRVIGLEGYISAIRPAQYVLDGNVWVLSSPGEVILI